MKSVLRLVLLALAVLLHGCAANELATGGECVGGDGNLPESPDRKDLGFWKIWSLKGWDTFFPFENRGASSDGASGDSLPLSSGSFLPTHVGQRKGPHGEAELKTAAEASDSGISSWLKMPEYNFSWPTKWRWSETHKADANRPSNSKIDVVPLSNSSSNLVAFREVPKESSSFSEISEALDKHWMGQPKEAVDHSMPESALVSEPKGDPSTSAAPLPTCTNWMDCFKRSIDWIPSFARYATLQQSRIEDSELQQVVCEAIVNADEQMLKTMGPLPHGFQDSGYPLYLSLSDDLRGEVIAFPSRSSPISYAIQKQYNWMPLPNYSRSLSMARKQLCASSKAATAFEPYHGWIPLALSDDSIPPPTRDSKVVAFVLPGNPGVVDFYDEFAYEMFTALNEEVDFFLLGFVGHTKLTCNGKLNYYSDQLDHLVRLVRGISQLYDANTKYLLIGHSTGALLGMHMLDIFKGELDIIKLLMVFPALENLLESPRGKALKNYCAYPTLTAAIFFAKAAFQSKEKFKTTVESMLHNNERYATVAMDKLLYFNQVRNALCLLADTDSKTRTDNSQILRKFESKIVAFYSDSDHWIPNERIDNLKSLCPGMEIYVLEEKTPHDFVFSKSGYVGSVLIRKIYQIGSQLGISQLMPAREKAQAAAPSTIFGKLYSHVSGKH